MTTFHATVVHSRAASTANTEQRIDIKSKGSGTNLHDAQTNCLAASNGRETQQTEQQAFTLRSTWMLLASES